MIPILLVFVAAACGQTPQPPAVNAAPSEWRDFEGSWSATGTRHTIALGAERKGSVIDVTGSMLLAGPGRPGVGFRAEAIGLTDSATGFAGRSVWTDEHGDQVFSELKGEGTATSNRITGAFLGGTGRFAGVTGTYEFSWQYVLEAEDGSIQGRAIGLKGRYRIGTTAEGARP